MNLSKYDFHDGSVDEIEHDIEKLSILLQSAAIDSAKYNNNIALSFHRNNPPHDPYFVLRGKAHFYGVTKILFDQQPFHSQFKMLAESAEILDLEFSLHRIRLFLKWENYPPFRRIEKYSEVVIVFDHMKWENLPLRIPKKKTIFECFQKRPKLKNQYLILDSGYVNLGQLTKPEFQDMYWTRFLLTPLTTNEFLLGRLYSQEFWLGNSIFIIEQDTGRVVKFFSALDFNENDETIDTLKDRPPQISLRGPYWIEGDS